MTVYDSDQWVADYVAAYEGLDGRDHIDRLAELIAPGASVLELGSGPGIDLALLAQRFDATGSDPSAAFREHYERTKAASARAMLDLDARSLEFDSVAPANAAHDGESTKAFAAIYSNKVLHHLHPHEHQRSATLQHRCLSPGGIVVHTYWHGEEQSTQGDLLFQHYTGDSLRKAWTAGQLGQLFEILEIEPYSELGHHDSLRLAGRAVAIEV